MGCVSWKSMPLTGPAKCILSKPWVKELLTIVVFILIKKALSAVVEEVNAAVVK